MSTEILSVPLHLDDQGGKKTILNHCLASQQFAIASPVGNLLRAKWIKEG